MLCGADLVPYIGSKSKVSEVLSGKRPLSLSMVRKLHQGLGLPAEALLREPGTGLSAKYEGIDWRGFPLAEMRKRGWFSDVRGRARDLLENAEEILGPFLFQAGLQEPKAAWLRERRQPGVRTDEAALWAWLARVLQIANRQEVGIYEPGIVTEEFIRGIAQLGHLKDGPRLAEESLLKSGIHFVIEKHLPRTRLDGAAFCCADGLPVVALTLRYDRLDHFWFTLCHELAHVARHLDAATQRTFIDDLDAESKDAKEEEADRIAADALIPPPQWQEIKKRTLTHREVIQVANRLRVHPAVVAGQIRREKQNYSLYANLVGHGKLRRVFGAVGGRVQGA